MPAPQCLAVECMGNFIDSFPYMPMGPIFFGDSPPLAEIPADLGCEFVRSAAVFRGYPGSP